MQMNKTATEMFEKKLIKNQDLISLSPNKTCFQPCGRCNPKRLQHGAETKATDDNNRIRSNLYFDTLKPRLKFDLRFYSFLRW